MDPLPKTGETYCCPRCGFAVSVTADCACDNMHAVVLKCCNAALEKETEETKKAKKAKVETTHHESHKHK